MSDYLEGGDIEMLTREVTAANDDFTRLISELEEEVGSVERDMIATEDLAPVDASEVGEALVEFAELEDGIEDEL